MSTLRLAIDVGGTNTDAVVVDDGGAVLASVKQATTADPVDGIRESLQQVIAGVDPAAIAQAMLGTTHPVNALIERKGLARVGVLRFGAPTTLAVQPLCGWSQDLRTAVEGPIAIVHGGHEIDGGQITELDPDEVRRFAGACAGRVDAIAVSGVFSLAYPEHELRAAEILHAELGDDVAVTLSHRIGQLGLIERENATILNAALMPVAEAVVEGFEAALRDHGLRAETFITQNDGTLMASEEALRLPVLCLGSGPTNSMRGAAYLTGIADALVVDVGGTSSDVGMLVGGFPRESAQAVEIGGVRTNFRMPDLVSVGIGGGTVIDAGPPLAVGPGSVGYRLRRDALVFGGGVPTLTDVAVASGRTQLGEPSRAAAMAAATVRDALAWVDREVARLCDQMKSSHAPVPLIAVGGGAHLLPDALPGVTEVVKPRHHAVANAIGAAIAEASGTVEKVYLYDEVGRETALDEARALAIDAAVRAGARAGEVRITAVTEVPLPYVPGQACRVQVKAAGALERPVAAADGRSA